jgi:hypothetical protein
MISPFEGGLRGMIKRFLNNRNMITHTSLYPSREDCIDVSLLEEGLREVKNLKLNK